MRCSMIEKETLKNKNSPPLVDSLRSASLQVQWIYFFMSFKRTSGASQWETFEVFVFEIRNFNPLMVKKGFESHSTWIDATSKYAEIEISFKFSINCLSFVNGMNISNIQYSNALLSSAGAWETRFFKWLLNWLDKIRIRKKKVASWVREESWLDQVQHSVEWQHIQIKGIKELK